MKELNNSIQEPICSSEVSQLLKDKGFKDPYYSCPTHSIALEWIRVNFGVHIRVERNYRRPLLDEPAPEPVFTVDIDNLHSKSGKAYSDVVNGYFDTPQKAIEAGLLYALTNLIH